MNETTKHIKLLVNNRFNELTLDEARGKYDFVNYNNTPYLFILEIPNKYLYAALPLVEGSSFGTYEIWEGVEGNIATLTTHRINYSVT